MYESIVVGVGGARYGLPMAKVVEVIGLSHTTPVPLGPRALVGLMHLRGQIILVVDLQSLLAKESIDRAILPDEPLLVIRSAETLIGLRVDEVLGPVSDDNATPVDIDALLVQLKQA